MFTKRIKNMKGISLTKITASLALLAYLTGCGDAPVSGDTAQNPHVSVRSDLDAKAYSSYGDGSQTSSAKGLTVDSLIVTSAMMITSDLKLHSGNDYSVEQVGNLRLGQFLLIFDSSGTNYISDVQVLAGTYERVKFEVHPVTGSLDSLVFVDNRYAEFVTSGPATTVIIYGYTYRNGVQLPFVFSSGVVLNGQFIFDSPFVLRDGMREALRVRFLSQEAFSIDGVVLDPMDIRNHIDIENNLRGSVKIFRL